MFANFRTKYTMTNINFKNFRISVVDWVYGNAF